MSRARIHEETRYYAFCDSCAEGTEILSHDDAMAWAQQHNDEYHSDLDHDKDQP